MGGGVADHRHQWTAPDGRFSIEPFDWLCEMHLLYCMLTNREGIRIPSTSVQEGKCPTFMQCHDYLHVAVRLRAQTVSSNCDG